MGPRWKITLFIPGCRDCNKLWLTARRCSCFPRRKTQAGADQSCWCWGWENPQNQVEGGGYCNLWTIFQSMSRSPLVSLWGEIKKSTYCSVSSCMCAEEERRSSVWGGEEQMLSLIRFNDHKSKNREGWVKEERWLIHAKGNVVQSQACGSVCSFTPQFVSEEKSRCSPQMKKKKSLNREENIDTYLLFPPLLPLVLCVLQHLFPPQIKEIRWICVKLEAFLPIIPADKKKGLFGSGFWSKRLQ